MKNQIAIHLHIISFDLPYPANYGGVIDVFYKAKALTDFGVKVHLHCFESEFKNSAELENLFYKVSYYKQDLSKKLIFKTKPFIVVTRQSEQLIQNLLLDKHPILMEGLHTSILLLEKRLQHRIRIVRTHNIEHEYYNNLSKAETNIIKKAYYFIESIKLKNYEKILRRATHLLTISKTDQDYFSSKYKPTVYLPPFHPHNEVSSLTGKGDYVLYHGNLLIPENISAVTKLINEVFKDTKIPFKIAGLSPPSSLFQLASENPLIEIIASPDDKKLEGLIRNAHVNILYTDQATGLKLKLLNAIYNGRFILANDKIVAGSNLEKLCIIANVFHQMKMELKALMKKSFSTSIKANRQRQLLSIDVREKNIEKLIELIS